MEALSHDQQSVTQGRRSAPEIAYTKPTLSKNDIKSVMECMVSDEISHGKIVDNYEKEFAGVFEVGYSISTSSLTSAYHLTLMAMGLTPEDEVLIPSTAPLAALDAINQIGAKVCLADIDRSGFHPSDETLVNLIKEETRVIILTYPFGAFHGYQELRTKVDEINRSSKKKIMLLEDISYIAGIEYSGSYVGTTSDAVIVGLHDDMLMTIGKGAMVLTNSKTIFSAARDLRMHGGNRPYRVRYDYAITDYQAAMGGEQLGQLSAVLDRRRRMGAKYLETMVPLKQLSSGFRHPEYDAFGAFPVLSDKPFEYVQRFFRSLQIGTRRTLQFGPLHGMLGMPAADFPNTERLYERGILIPLYPNLTKGGLERIVNALKGFY